MTFCKQPPQLPPQLSSSTATLQTPKNLTRKRLSFRQAKHSAGLMGIYPPTVGPSSTMLNRRPAHFSSTLCLLNYLAPSMNLRVSQANHRHSNNDMQIINFNCFALRRKHEVLTFTLRLFNKVYDRLGEAANCAGARPTGRSEWADAAVKYAIRIYTDLHGFTRMKLHVRHINKILCGSLPKKLCWCKNK